MSCASLEISSVGPRRPDQSRPAGGLSHRPWGLLPKRERGGFYSDDRDRSRRACPGAVARESQPTTQRKIKRKIQSRKRIKRKIKSLSRIGQEAKTRPADRPALDPNLALDLLPNPNPPLTPSLLPPWQLAAFQLPVSNSCTSNSAAGLRPTTRSRSPIACRASLPVSHR